MILVIDNYDSFTYNLVQYLGVLGEEITVVRNDKADIRWIEELQAERIVLSPGPGTPDDAGICKDVIRHFSGKVPLLGVCLGHQCIGEVFGFPVVRAEEPVHGKTSPIFHVGKGLFKQIPQGIKATRYHSLILENSRQERDLEVTAWTAGGTIMAVQHRSHPTFGVQFHPESIATDYGLEILKNFLVGWTD